MRKGALAIIIGLAFVTGSLALLAPHDASAQNERPRPGDRNSKTGIVCGEGVITIPGCVNNTVSYESVRTRFFPQYSIFQVAVIGMISVIVVTMAGVFLVTSMGDPGKKKKAMGMVYNALIAIIVAMLAYVIVQLVVGLDFTVTASLPSAMAQGAGGLIPSPPAGKGVNIPAGNAEQNLGYFAQTGLNVIFSVAGPLVVIAFFIIGIRLVMAEGKSDEFKKGMKAMGYAALGLSLIGLAYAVIRTVLSIRF